jgi:hypothetical protein
MACHRLKRAAESDEYPWLKVLDDSAHFVFVIGGNNQGVPVRFYRGPADGPTERTLCRQEGEAAGWSALSSSRCVVRSRSSASGPCR